MSLADNKDLVRRFINEVFNAGDTEAIPKFCVSGSMFAGGIAGQVKSMKTAFPDQKFTIDNIVAEGDKVAVQLTINGTNSGPLIGLPAFGRLETPIKPTYKTITASSIYIFTISNERIMSFTFELDQIAILRQLGWRFTPTDETQA
jgi:predicted ester cyclase